MALERCSKFSCGFHTIIQTLRQSLRFAYVSQVLAYDRYVSMIWAYGDLTAKKVASKLNFNEIPYKSIVALRFSGGYVSLLGSILLGPSGHLVKPCETDPMGQGSLLAVLAYGGLTFRLRFAYGRDSYSFGFSKSLQSYNKIPYKWNWIRRWSLIILKIHLRQPYGCGTLCMTYAKPYGYLTNFRKKLTTCMNSSKPKMWPIHMEFRTLLTYPRITSGHRHHALPPAHSALRSSLGTALWRTIKAATSETHLK